MHCSLPLGSLDHLLGLVRVPRVRDDEPPPSRKVVSRAPYGEEAHHREVTRVTRPPRAS
jgi:hypothetical protein